MAGYKLATYRSPQGPRAGVVIGETIFDAAALTGHAPYVTMLDILNDWDAARGAIETASKKHDKAAGLPLEHITLLAPVRWPSAIYCAGANFTDHMMEMAEVQNVAPEPDPHAVGLKPWHFIKASRAVADPNTTVTLPPHSKMVDWEAELTAVIGRKAKNVPLDQALDYVAGYTAANDLSARDLTKRPHVSDTSPFKFD